MKALFSRLNRGLSKDKPKDGPDPILPSYHKEKLQLPPLPDWPPNRAAAGTPSSLASYKPLPDISSRPLPPIDEPLPPFPPDSDPPRPPLSDVLEEPSQPPVVSRVASRAEQDSAGRSSRKTANGSVSTSNGNQDVQKKVAFISPPPTPAGLNNDRPLPADGPSAPAKATTSRSQPKETRGSTSTAASASRADVGSTSRASNTTVKATSTRNATSPYPQKGYADAASVHQSLRSGTPYSQRSATGSVIPPASWSEGAEEDLVSNLGPRERTRQEVLWEIVASEERYIPPFSFLDSLRVRVR